MSFRALRALGYFLAAVIFFGGLVSGARLLDPQLRVSLPAWAASAGWVVAAAGTVLGAWCFGVFVLQGQGTPFIVDPPQSLVAAGPYKHVRNPLYVAQVLILVGLSLGFASVSVLLLAVVWFLLLELFVVYVEEPELEKRFGAAYDAYRRQVPRWLPDRRHESADIPN